MLRRLGASPASSVAARVVVRHLPALHFARRPPFIAAACRPLSSAVAYSHQTDSSLQPSASSGLAYFAALSNEIGPLALNQIRDNVGARRKKRRVGRGVGSGRGRTAGRGHKGTGQRAGNHGMLKIDGGQTRLQKVLPKLGHFRPRRTYEYINLWKIQQAVERGRLPVPKDRPIDVKDLFDAKLITLRQKSAGVKLLGREKKKFTMPLRIETQLASQRAIEVVEAAGGTVESVYYNRLTLRNKLKPHKFEAAPPGRRHGDMRPRPVLPPPKLMRDIYLSERHRGYLRNLQPGDVVRPQEHPAHVDLSLRVKPKYPGWAAADQQAMAEGKPFIKANGRVANAEERTAAQQRAPYASQLLQEIPTRRRDRGYVPPLPRSKPESE